MTKRILLAAFALFLLSVVPTQAQVTVQLGGLGNNLGGTVAGDSIGPYTGTVNGVYTQFFCIDFATNVGAGASWNAVVTLLANSSSYVNTLQYTNNGKSNAIALNNYLVMAYLATQAETALAANNFTALAQDQFAIWSFTGGPDPYGTNATLLAAAQAAVTGGFTVTGWQILSPAPLGSGGQEFLVATPESPSTVLFMLGIVLVAVAAAYRKMQQRAA